MTKAMTEISSAARLTTDVFATSAFESLFWRPRLMLDSPVVAHLPLLFWVCAAMRPTDVTVVGVGDGVVHFALCQAIDKFNDQGRCTGYGFWKEPESSDVAKHVPPKLASHQEMLYEDVSQLFIGEDLDVAADGLPQDSLDLLWLDLSAAPEGLCQRAELFSQALKPTGVMFVHGISDVPDNSPNGAAIKRLLSTHRCVRFNDEKGLLLVFFDADLPARIESLVLASKGTLLSPEVERPFRRVGQGLLSAVRAADALTAEKNTAKRLSNANVALENTESALQNLNSAYEHRNRKIAEKQSELHDTRLLVTELKAQMAAIAAEYRADQFSHKNGMVEAEQKRVALSDQADNLRDQLAAASEARIALEVAHKKALAEMDQQRNRISAEADRLRDQLTAADEAGSALEAAHETALTEVEELWETISDEADSLRDQLTVAGKARIGLEAAHEKTLAEVEQQRDAISDEANSLRDQLTVADEARSAREAAHEKALAEVEQQQEAIQKSLDSERSTRFSETASLTRMAEDLRDDIAQLKLRNSLLEGSVEASQKFIQQAEQQRDAKSDEADELRGQLAVADKASVALTAAHETALAEVEQQQDAIQKSLDSERNTRFSETAALTRMAEHLRNDIANLQSQNSELEKSLEASQKSAKQSEADLKAGIANERQTRFRESATLTHIIEGLNAEKDCKNRLIETWLIAKLVRNDRKRKKYRRDRPAFFLDSQSIVMRAYFRLRPGL